ncbi:hypothetical protein SODALDRAFT_328034 [Sodiomyces alkalinus F11]|uniref:Nucleoside 2-deoxyribosyltransferase n=1 Tax=Sodiomyces alkalinus (strain CBS 110278 / VKM F-3762 / F11) TaxID=1314773 RepID=A0A3N2QB38_SODAK|nr:hypothetical protein SODALDRAFT_328034 [Sodiomyces alkalinus F11]ROT43828.1 hypothetical protein SODALDRAFT_328034 [Sodiomyces alkalinus F11]
MSLVVLAPARPPLPPDHKTIFLAGTTSTTDPDQQDWRSTLSDALASLSLPIVILNPFRPDWDDTWREDVSDQRFVEQTTWELDMQHHAGLVVFYFHPDTKAPVSLLELGLAAHSGKLVVVCCPAAFWKRGNVEIVCARYGLTLVDSLDDLRDVVVKQLETQHGRISL